MSLMIQLAVFLGNPGKQYDRTRHNIAWLLLESLSFYPGLHWQRKFKGEYATHRSGAYTCYVHKPLTYMNLSGESVSAIASFFRISPDHILVVHDEVELEPGDVSLKYGGGLAGHRGLKSVAAALGTREYARLRIGIGRPAKGTVSSHVLGAMGPRELDQFSPVFDRAGDIIGGLMQGTG